MDEYLKEINKREILTKKEERKLWRDYQERGINEARQELIKSYQPLVFKLACQLTVNEQLKMDLIQEGNIGLINAVESFNADYGTPFSTFACYYVKGRMKNFLQQGIKLDLDYQDLREQSLEKKVEKKFLIGVIKENIFELPRKEQEIIKQLYFNHQTPKAVAVEMDISLSYLYRLQKKAFRRLRGKLSNFIKTWNQS